MARYLLVHISYQFLPGKSKLHPDRWKYDYWVINQENPLGPLECMPGYLFTEKRFEGDDMEPALTLKDAQVVVEGFLSDESKSAEYFKDIRPK